MPPPRPRTDTPSLIVLLVVDQLRGDYLDRFGTVLDGGLAWLQENGTSYSAAYQNHATTETAPGHATIATGVEPSRSGIVANAWFNRETGAQEYSVGNVGSSPVNLEVTALGDWLKAADPRSKVFSASAKDRSAVMMGGQRPDAAYWYARWSGEFVSGPYYRSAGRPWVDEFNAQNWLLQYYGQLWEPRVSEAQRRELDLVDLDTGVISWGTPHALGSFSITPGASFYGDAYASPLVDSYLGEFAKALIDNERLGADGSPDLLAISFSALDSVGHRYGPHSLEAADTLIRLDAVLKDLIEHIDAAVGLEHVVFALSADHGVTDFPEVRAARGQDGRRIAPTDYACVQSAREGLVRKYGDGPWNPYGTYLDARILAAAGFDVPEVARDLADALSACEAVEHAWTVADLEALPAEGGTTTEERFRNNYFPGRTPDVMLQFRPNYLFDQDPLGTSHGSVYDHDAWVPMIFAGPGIANGRLDRRVATVDIAPTLARLTGVDPPSDLDGEDLSGELQRRQR